MKHFAIAQKLLFTVSAIIICSGVGYAIVTGYQALHTLQNVIHNIGGQIDTNGTNTTSLIELRNHQIQALQDQINQLNARLSELEKKAGLIPLGLTNTVPPSPASTRPRSSSQPTTSTPQPTRQPTPQPTPRPTPTAQPSPTLCLPLICTPMNGASAYVGLLLVQ